MPTAAQTSESTAVNTNLAASSLGAGTYRVDISINKATVGHAVFALKWLGFSKTNMSVPEELRNHPLCEFLLSRYLFRRGNLRESPQRIDGLLFVRSFATAFCC